MHQYSFLQPYGAPRPRPLHARNVYCRGLRALPQLEGPRPPERPDQGPGVIRLKEKILVHLSPPPGGRFFCLFVYVCFVVFWFTVFILMLGFGVFCVF